MKKKHFHKIKNIVFFSFVYCLMSIVCICLMSKLSYVYCLISIVLYLLSYVYVLCLLSYVYCMSLSYVYCLMSIVLCLLSYIYCLMSIVLCLLSYVYCIMSIVISLLVKFLNWKLSPLYLKVELLLPEICLNLRTRSRALA